MFFNFFLYSFLKLFWNPYFNLLGGYGTMEELLEMIAWSQLGIHDKPVLNMDLPDLIFTFTLIFFLNLEFGLQFHIG